MNKLLSDKKKLRKLAAAAVAVALLAVVWAVVHPKDEQRLTGKESYEVMNTDAPFDLGIEGAKTALTYESSDEKVATVSEQGTVSPCKAGECVISVKAAEDWNYEAASFDVKIKVENYQGWRTIGGGKYYYRDGEMVRYRQTIDGKDYYFNSDYEMVTERVIYFKKLGKSFYYQPNGTRKTEKGFVKVRGKKYYLLKGGRIRTGKFRIYDMQYIADERGVINEEKSLLPVNYESTTRAYTLVNDFRTGDGVWQWQKNNKNKTVFNTGDDNRLGKLARNNELERIAQVRAEEISRKFSHTRPNGSSGASMLPQGITNYGENIAHGYDSAEEVVERFMETDKKYAGQPHRRNMLGNYNAVGIACYVKNGKKYWVMSFGTVK